VEDILVVMVGLVVVGLLGDEFCGMYVQEEKKKKFQAFIKSKARAAVAPIGLSAWRSTDM
jgi:hypothetical protein